MECSERCDVPDEVADDGGGVVTTADGDRGSGGMGVGGVMANMNVEALGWCAIGVDVIDEVPGAASDDDMDDMDDEMV
jgi:hypothetical protein